MTAIGVSRTNITWNSTRHDLQSSDHPPTAASIDQDSCTHQSERPGNPAETASEIGQNLISMQRPAHCSANSAVRSPASWRPSHAWSASKWQRGHQQRQDPLARTAQAHTAIVVPSLGVGDPRRSQTGRSMQGRRRRIAVGR
jgi:hypothetical protein